LEDCCGHPTKAFVPAQTHGLHQVGLTGKIHFDTAKMSLPIDTLYASIAPPNMTATQMFEGKFGSALPSRMTGSQLFTMLFSVVVPAEYTTQYNAGRSVIIENLEYDGSIVSGFSFFEVFKTPELLCFNVDKISSHPNPVFTGGVDLMIAPASRVDMTLYGAVHTPVASAGGKTAMQCANETFSSFGIETALSGPSSSDLFALNRGVK
jgi:hypothetical protein